MMVRLASLAVLMGAFGCQTRSNTWHLPERQFVLTSLTLPATEDEATNLALDLDHNGTPDNQLGKIAAFFLRQDGWSAQTSLDAQMARGDSIFLLAVYASDMASSDRANVWTFLGLPRSLSDGPQPGGTFEVDLTNGPSNAWLAGDIKDGTGDFGGDEATVWLKLAPFGDSPIELRAAHLSFDLSADGERLENGHLAGAITESDVQGKLLPGLQATIGAAVGADCSLASGLCTCTSGSEAEILQNAFDSDGNCEVALEEIQNNDIVKAFAKGDVTLDDGTRALSVALGFTAVRAVFSHPAPPATDPEPDDAL